MKYRVKKSVCHFLDGDGYYPEERYSWLPFWFRFDDGQCGQVAFATPKEAKEFIELHESKTKKEDETNTAWQGVDADKFVEDLRSGELNLTKEKP